MSCPDCFKGHVHQGTPGGAIERVHGLQTYVATPAAGVHPKGIIVMISDAFGWDFINNRILADNYAKKGGFIVYLPDFMNGHSMSTSILTLGAKVESKASWITTLLLKPLWIAQMATMVIPWLIANRPAVAKPRILSFFRALRTSAPPFGTDSLKIGAAGFCWGGKYTIHLAADTPSSRVIRHQSQVTSPSLAPLIDCGFTAHPSMVSVPKDIEEVEVPLSVAIGDVDMAMSGPLILEMKDILEKKSNAHEVVVMPGAKHGFAIRTDPDLPLQMEYADKAEVQAIEWFSKWFV